MKWFSHLAAMTFGIALIESVHLMGVSANPWGEPLFWFVLSVVFLGGYHYRKRRTEASPVE